MPSYTPPLRDMRFILHEVLEITRHKDVPQFAELSEEDIDSILAEAGRYASEVAQPLNAVGDRQGCRWHDGQVFTPEGFRDAYSRYVEGGWPSLTAPAEYGGQGLPKILGVAVVEMLTASNWGLSSYPGLTAHAVTPLHHFGSEELKTTFLPKMISGEWSATMNLTEPHAGSDLGLLRTRAVPSADGSYRISGTKIFITAGEHDLAENIVHLVLARLHDAPPGVKGISLFLIPKFLVRSDGTLGDRNAVRCSRVEEKMGIHSSATCELVYDNAIGFLVGEPNRGLAAMFTMMNEARLGAGVQGVAIADVAYQNAVAYARSRRQGRLPAGALEPTASADPIIAHPDIRRMLLSIRSFSEGARALTFWGALQAELAEHHPQEDTRREAADLLDALTPVIKAHLTDEGFEAASMAVQCLGGHGYIREWGLEQFVRDARIAPIYEGTNGVQAMDLIGRKLFAHGGRCIEAFLTIVRQCCNANVDDLKLQAMLAQLRTLLTAAETSTRTLQQRIPSEPMLAGAVAADYLKVIGILAMGYMWARMCKVAIERLTADTSQRSYYMAKLALGEFYFSKSLPVAHTSLARIETGAGPVLAMPLESY